MIAFQSFRPCEISDLLDPKRWDLTLLSRATRCSQTPHAHSNMPRAKLGKSSVLFGVEPWQGKRVADDRGDPARNVADDSVDFIAVMDSKSPVENATDANFKRPRRAGIETPWTSCKSYRCVHHWPHALHG
jgi:hypothetical protein